MAVVDHLHAFASMRRWDSMQPDYAFAAAEVAIEAAHQSRRLGICFQVQVPTPLAAAPPPIRTDNNVGVRSKPIASLRNYRATRVCNDNATGLTRLGCAVVGEIRRLQIVARNIHLHCWTSADHLETATNPVAFLHRNVCARVRRPRNIPGGLVTT
jgi:microsomal dipeptidase-like Zn-dependent dipeptidase